MGGGCPLIGTQLAFLIGSASVPGTFDLRQIPSLSPWPDGRGYFVPKRGEGSALNPMSFLDISDTPKMAVFSSAFRRLFPNSDLTLSAMICADVIGAELGLKNGSSEKKSAKFRCGHTPVNPPPRALHITNTSNQSGD